MPVVFVYLFFLRKNYVTVLSDLRYYDNLSMSDMMYFL